MSFLGLNSGLGKIAVVLKNGRQTIHILLGQFGDDGLPAVSRVNTAQLQALLDDLEPQNVAVRVPLGEQGQIRPDQLLLGLHRLLGPARRGQLIDGAVLLGEQIPRANHPAVAPGGLGFDRAHVIAIEDVEVLVRQTAQVLLTEHIGLALLNGVDAPLIVQAGNEAVVQQHGRIY